MNNTHKLLLAFIEASGYEVEAVQTPGSVIAQKVMAEEGCKSMLPIN